MGMILTNDQIIIISELRKRIYDLMCKHDMYGT